MASYMCTFPAQYLDELWDVISTLPLIARLFDISLMNNAGNRAILVTGKGGIGKTHLLCDIVHDFVDRGIPAVLLLGDMFKGKDTVDNVIINWFQKGETIENFFAWLNEYGNQNNVYVPICIDAINEVDDNSYWNSNLPLIIAKAEAYSNIKIIVSCRSIYLEEYLDEEKIGGMLQVPHSGFDEMEVEALGSFCEYYGVNINYDTTCVPEFMNPLFLKMLCEIAIGKEDKTVVVEDIQTLMGEFFDVKNKIIMKNAKYSINANLVYKNGYSGKNVNIAVLDTGVFKHKQLDGCIKHFMDFVGGKETCYDDNGHGTHVCGILSAADIGMAPGAGLYVFKVLDYLGMGQTADSIRALKYIKENCVRLNIKILNFSVGYLPCSDTEDRIFGDAHGSAPSVRGTCEGRDAVPHMQCPRNGSAPVQNDPSF